MPFEPGDFDAAVDAKAAKVTDPGKTVDKSNEASRRLGSDKTTPQKDEANSSGNVSTRPWMRLAGLGIELASFTLGLAAIGYLVDTRRGHATPYATAFGALIGFGYGMFRFIQKATRGL